MNHFTVASTYMAIYMVLHQKKYMNYTSASWSVYLNTNLFVLDLTYAQKKNWASTYLICLFKQSKWL